VAGDHFDLERYREEVQRCMRCGYCRAQCPTWGVVGWESGSPRGRMQLIKMLLDRRGEANEYVMSRLYECALCGYCLWRCPPGVETNDAILAARAYLAERGLIPEGAEAAVRNVNESHGIYELPAEARTDWIGYMGLDGLVPNAERADVIYFPGCVSSMSGRAMGIASASSQILSALGLDWSILGEDEWCCGNPLLLSGQVSMAREVATRNLRALRGKGAKTLVTSCPGCARTFAEQYPRLVGEKGLNVMHITELLEKERASGRLRFTRSLGVKAIYHDPCDLGRHLGLYEPPRTVLRMVPGLSLAEFERNKATAACCGGGGMLKATYPDLALTLASKKLEGARSANAEVIVSSCPACKLNISDAIAASGSSVRMLDITEVVAEAMGLRVE